MRQIISAVPAEAQASCVNRGVVISAAGGPDVLRWAEPLALAPLDEDELLIRVAYAGVNRHDCNQRRRGPTSAHSDVPGLEVSGLVCATGSRVTRFQRGDKVCALVDGGGYATHVVAPAALAFKVEPPLDLASAAALPEAMFTVWHNFFGVAALGPGESVLIHGGTSGVGSLAIQLLQVLGHPVYATCGSDDKARAALQLGARVAINYHTQDFVREIQRATRDRGVDVILDMAGATHAARNVEALARRGRLVHLSPGDGAEFRAPLRAIMAKEARITGSLLRPLPLVEKSQIADQLRRVVLPLIHEGRVRAWVQETYPLRNASAAHARLESGLSMGKIVLEVNPAEPGASATSSFSV